jgi:small nuclear ribonucleoprotein (snRNP)-like protein
MEKQLASTLVVFIFCLLYTVAIAAQTKAPAPLTSPDKTRAEVQRFGFGKRVKVRLQNGTRFQGRITGLSDCQFVVSDGETGATMKVAYSEVRSVNKQRELPRIFQGVVVGVAVTAAVVGTLVVWAIAVAD